MTTDGLLLGLDVGSSRIKALLLHANGAEAGSAVVDTPFRTTPAGTEMTVDDLEAAVRDVLGRVGPGRAEVAGVGIAGLADSGAPLDGTGRPLAPILAWHDRRGETVADRLMDRFGTGLAERIGQRLRYVSSVAKLGWLLEEGLTGAARWLGVPELCLRALTGASATEHSLAARTGCWDIGSGTWLGEVAEAAGLDVGLFAEVRPAGSAMGWVSAEAAAWSGLAAGVPVTVAGHDHLAGVVGSGAAMADLVNSVGTAETVVGRSAELPDMGPALERGVAVTVFPGGEGWAVLASGARAGLAVEKAAAALGRSPAELDRLATGASPIDAPGLLESLRQRDPPELPPGETGEVWFTLLDALAQLAAEAVDQVRAVLGGPERLVVFGGGSASEPWLAAKARRTGMPVWRVVTREAVARGAALLGGVAAGWWGSADEFPKADLEPAGT